MTKKTKKLVSKIICALIVPLVLFVNIGAAQIAYAAPAKQKAADKATTETPKQAAPIKCPEGFTNKEGAGSLNCTADDAAKTTACPSGFTKVNYLSEDGKKLTCKQNQPLLTGEAKKEFLNTIAVMGGIQSALNRLIWPVLVLTGGLMENDLLFGNGMEEKLRDIWIPIRNLVNILFVVVLVGLALYNVLGLAEEGTSIKSLLPKIIVGIIAVNFSFIAIKVVLDGINVLTTSIFALPAQVSEGLDKVVNSTTDTKVIEKLCSKLQDATSASFAAEDQIVLQQQSDAIVYKNVANKSPYKEAADIQPNDPLDTIKSKIANMKNDSSGVLKKAFADEVIALKNGSICYGKTLTAQGKVFLQHYNSRNAAFALALNMGQIVFYNDVDPKIAGTTGDQIEKVFTNTLFSMVLYLIYCASFIALFIVLLGRLVVMWLCIAVSPILLLMIAAPTLKDKLGGLSELSTTFMKNAFAPLLISLSLTVGWIMLKAVQGMTPELGGATSNLLLNPSNGLPVANMNTLQDFIVAIGVIAVVWLGVFAAAKDTVAGFATDWIKEHLTTAGKWIGSVPFKHAPIIPIALPGHPHGHYDKFTLSSVGHYIKDMASSSKKDNELIEKARGEKATSPDEMKEMTSEAQLVSTLKRAGGKGHLDDKKELEKYVQKFKENPRHLELLREMKGKGGDSEKLAKQMEILMNPSSTEKQVEDAVKAIKGNGLYKDASSTAPKIPPKTDAKPEAPKPLPPETEVGTDAAGKKTTLGDIFQKNKKPDLVKIKTLSERKTKLDVAIDAKDKAKIEPEIRAIKAMWTAEGRPTITAPELEKLVGKEKYDAMQETVGGATELAKILNPTPPAAPAAGPTATPPPAGPTATP